jgi:hypothetical protein
MFKKNGVHQFSNTANSWVLEEAAVIYRHFRPQKHGYLWTQIKMFPDNKHSPGWWSIILVWEDAISLVGSSQTKMKEAVCTQLFWSILIVYVFRYISRTVYEIFHFIRLGSILLTGSFPHSFSNSYTMLQLIYIMTSYLDFSVWWSKKQRFHQTPHPICTTFTKLS